MIKNIIFDFGKVLVNYDFDQFTAKLFTDREEQLRFLHLVCDDDFVALCDKEDTPIQEIIDEQKRIHPEWEVQLQQFVDRFPEAVTGEIPGMRDLIHRLRSQGYGLYGLTNWSSLVHPTMERFEIMRMLDNRIISSEEHLLKPDVRIYQRFTEKFGLKAEECLFTDDKPVNVEGARAAGMHGIVFQDAIQFENDLQHYLRQ